MNGTTRARRRGIAAGMLGLGAALALAAPATVAVSQESPPLTLGLDIESPAVLVARGAAVLVPVEVVCTAGAEGQLFVSISQRAGSANATGFGVESFTCTGETQVIDVLVQGNTGRSFKKGVASSVSEAFVCNENGCANTRDEEVIQIVR
jgi:hypothetical protein